MERIKCPHCKTGILKTIQIACPVCKGEKGRFIETHFGKQYYACEHCAGAGWRFKQFRCEFCNGAGWLDA